VVGALASINEVNQRRARLVVRWVTVSRFNSRCGTFISVCDQPPRSTQPGYPFVGRRNEYQPKGGDALRVGSKGRYGPCVVAGKTVRSLRYTRAISECFTDKELIYKVLYKFSCLLTFTLLNVNTRSVLCHSAATFDAIYYMTYFRAPISSIVSRV